MDGHRLRILLQGVKSAEVDGQDAREIRSIEVSRCGESKGRLRCTVRLISVGVA